MKLNKEFFQSKKGRITTSVVILLLAAGLGYWYFNTKNDKKTPVSISKVQPTTPAKTTQPVTNPVTQPTTPATPTLNIDSIKNAAVEEIKAEMQRLQDSLDAKNNVANQPVKTPNPVVADTTKAAQVTLVIKTGDHNVRPPKGVIFQDSVGYSIRNSDYALLSDADKAQLNGKPFKKKM